MVTQIHLFYIECKSMKLSNSKTGQAKNDTVKKEISTFYSVVLGIVFYYGDILSCYLFHNQFRGFQKQDIKVGKMWKCGD